MLLPPSLVSAVLANAAICASCFCTCIARLDLARSVVAAAFHVLPAGYKENIVEPPAFGEIIP